MAFKFKNSKGQEYYLHSRSRRTNTGKTQMLYFFAREAGDGALDAVPEGYEIKETQTGLPVLKKK